MREYAYALEQAGSTERRAWRQAPVPYKRLALRYLAVGYLRTPKHSGKEELYVQLLTTPFPR